MRWFRCLGACRCLPLCQEFYGSGYGKRAGLRFWESFARPVRCHKAIKALAHKLARIIHRMLQTGKFYADCDELYYEHKYRDQLIKRLHKQAGFFGLQLTLVPV